MDKDVFVSSLINVTKEAEQNLIKNQSLEREARNIEIEDLKKRGSLEDQDASISNTVSPTIEEPSDAQIKLEESIVALTQINDEKSILLSELNEQQMIIQELGESVIQNTTLLQNKTRELNELNQAITGLSQRVSYSKELLKQRDLLIKESQLLKLIEDKGSEDVTVRSVAILSDDLKEKLDQYEGPADFEEKLFKLFDDRNNLLTAIGLLESDIKFYSEQPKVKFEDKKESLLNSEIEQTRRLKNLENQYSLKIQEVSLLKTRISSLESQVEHYRSSVETSESNEDAFRAENRKLRGTLREMNNKLSNAEVQNEILQKRLIKFKVSK